MSTLILTLLNAEAQLLPSEIQLIQNLVEALSGTTAPVPSAQLTAQQAALEAALAKLKP